MKLETLVSEFSDSLLKSKEKMFKFSFKGIISPQDLKIYFN